MTGGARRNAADTSSVPVNEEPSSAADIRALAEQAEAEAAEAEALAAAARARARAIGLRRQAEQVEARTREAAQQDTEDAATADAATADVATAEKDAAKAAPTQAQPTQEVEPEETESPLPPESADAKDAAEDAVAEQDADESVAPGEKPARRLRRPRRPKWSAVAACLAIIVALAALGASGYMIKAHRDAVRQREHAAQFAAAARQGVVTLTSLDFNNAKQGVQRILENSTGAFKDDFLKMADDFTKVVEQSKVISQGTVQATAVDLDSMTDNSAVVLVASTSEVTNAAGAKQDPRNYRLIVTVARDGDQIKIAKVEFVP